MLLGTLLLFLEGFSETSIFCIQQGDGTAFIFKEEPCVFTFSVHCGKNFPLRKQQGDLDISVEDGLEDKEYLSTGVSPQVIMINVLRGLTWLLQIKITTLSSIQKLICKLTNLWDDPQWRLTSLGCWKVSVQTWFCTTQVLTLIRKMSSGGSVLLTKVRDDFQDTKSTYKVLTGLSTYKSFFVSDCNNQDCIREICTWWRLWWAKVFLSPQLLVEDTQETSTNWPSDTPLFTEQQLRYGLLKWTSLVPNRSYFFKQWTKHHEKMLCCGLCFRSGGSVACKTFVPQEDIPTTRLHQDLETD